jgi:hypothetical protein
LVILRVTSNSGCVSSEYRPVKTVKRIVKIKIIFFIMFSRTLFGIAVKNLYSVYLDKNIQQALNYRRN